MKCHETDILLDARFQGHLDEAKRAELENHLKACAACRFKHQVMLDARSLDEEGEVPAAFSSAWRQQIRQEEVQPVKQGKRLLRWVAVAAALLVMVGGTYLAGQDRRLASFDAAAPAGKHGSNETFVAGMMDYASPQETMPEMPLNRSAAPAEVDAAQGGVAEKIIRTVRLELSTRQFEADQERIMSAVLKEGGRVQESRMFNNSANLRSLYLTLRVPSDKLDAVITSLKGVGRVQSVNESAQDITEQYADTAMRLKTQQAKMDRLQELLKKADSVEDLITIENSISDTQYQLDRLTGSLKGMDSRVDYATLDVSLNELSPLDTSKDKEETLTERIRSGVAAAFEEFKNLLADFVVFLSVALPYLLALVVVIIIIRLIVKRRKST